MNNSYEEERKRSMSKNIVLNFKQGIAAGLLISCGVVVNSMADNRWLGAVFFTIGILTIIHKGLKLYTGKIGFYKDVPASELAVMFVGNIIGILVPAYIVAFSKPEVMETMQAVSDKKYANSYLYMLLFGILCGMMVFTAVYCKNQLITVLGIATFIMCGFEHCIVDFAYLMLNISPANIVKFFCVVLGNSIGAIVLHWLMEDNTQKAVTENK